MDRRSTRSAIRAIGTAVPGTGVSQSDLLELMKRAHRADQALARRLDVLYRRSRIERRYSCLAPRGEPSEAAAFYPLPASGGRSPAASSPPTAGPSTAARMQVYREAVVPLAEAAVVAMRERLPAFDSSRVTHLLVASCTGFYAPGPDVDLARCLGLTPAIARTLIGFVGCHAGLSALRVADAICRADPRSVVLLVCVELCTLHFQIDPTDDNLLANSLFGDGACAVLVTAEEPGGAPPGDGVAGVHAARRLAIVRTASRLQPGGADAMAWTIGDRGFQMGLSALLPRLVELDIAAFVREALPLPSAVTGHSEFWAVHPGGPAILDRVERALALAPHCLDASRSVLRVFGNMSSPTVFFVIDRLWDAMPAGAHRHGRALAFGPGLTFEGAVLEAVESTP
ncbi:MAG: type III polyketide synthase [Candidatus Eiseniibacteriota bacterium]|jgi:predicted naringenin-chalcone synthase